MRAPGGRHTYTPPSARQELYFWELWSRSWSLNAVCSRSSGAHSPSGVCLLLHLLSSVLALRRPSGLTGSLACSFRVQVYLFGVALQRPPTSWWGPPSLPPGVLEGDSRSTLGHVTTCLLRGHRGAWSPCVKSRELRLDDRAHTVSFACTSTCLVLLQLFNLSLLYSHRPEISSILTYRRVCRAFFPSY